MLGVNETFDGVTVSPVPADLSYAKGKVATRFGAVSVDWSVKNGEFSLTVDASDCEKDLPVTVILPSGQKEVMSRSVMTFSCRYICML